MPKQPLLVGRPALLVIDLRKSAFLPGYDGGIPKMTDSVASMRRARTLIDAPRRAAA